MIDRLTLSDDEMTAKRSVDVARAPVDPTERGKELRVNLPLRAARSDRRPTSPSTVTISNQTVGIGKRQKAKHKQNFTYKTDAGSTLYGFKMR